MKKFLALCTLLAMLCGLVAPAFADNVAATPAAAPVAAPAAASAVAATAAPAPTPNKGDTTWMLTATLLVIMMSIPGLALFYGGLVRSKNMLSVLMQVFSIFALITVLWAIYGYSLAFTQGSGALSPFIGGFDRLFLKGIFDPVSGSVANAATFSKGVVIPEFAFVAFQATFAAITVALIVGAFAERMKFASVLLFSALWFTFAYLPIAHMVWFWMGPDAYTDQAAADTATAAAGWLFQKGALDFAGGTVVHINAAVAGLVGAFLIGKRIGYGKEPMAPHNLVMTMIGGSLLWVGWFGFNAGSALEAGGTAALAFMNTLDATAAAALTWSLAEWLLRGKPSVLGGVSGAVAGLVAITPACGWVGVGGGLVIGAIAGVACFWGVTGLKKMLGMDDALDVFGVHGVGGILGALLTGVFNNWGMGGTGIVDYVNNKIIDTEIGAQVWIQAQAVLTTIIWSGVVAFVCYKIVDLTIGLRVPEEAEREGLDTTSHGERAYNL
ncbi:MAG: ammonium transporter [Nitrosomonadales bacterium]|nr:ammonium transporter [Nitrosomonadales bacterium]